jgi:methoxymalonate biosynthesis acyl carrier protein
VNDLLPRLLRFVEQDLPDGTDLQPDTDLLLSGTLDSLGVVRVVHWLEDELGIEIDPADVVLEHFQTVDAMVAYAERRLADG